MLDTASGTETLTFLDGEVPSGGARPEYLFTDDTVRSVARLVRRFHDATWSFCHNDLAPWNHRSDLESPFM